MDDKCMTASLRHTVEAQRNRHACLAQARSATRGASARIACPPRMAQPCRAIRSSPCV